MNFFNKLTINLLFFDYFKINPHNLFFYSFLFILLRILLLVTKDEINYSNNSLCYGFTGISKYKIRKGECKLNCDIRTNYHFKNYSSDTCFMRQNFSLIVNNKLYVSNSSEITQYYYEKNKWRNKIDYVYVYYF